MQLTHLSAVLLLSGAYAAVAPEGPAPTEIPGGCNPAHPGSCPESTEIPGGLGCNPAHPGSCPESTQIPGGCNPAHPGSCPTPTEIPGGCNPAHPGSCATPTGIPGGCNPAHPGSCPSVTVVSGSSTYMSPVPVATSSGTFSGNLTSSSLNPLFTGAASNNQLHYGALLTGVIALTARAFF
ncbi:hypothetical protein AARAC_009001 [Aspergillus arachidicola]|uniref:GPI anchored protein n=1 Tax=Aspergillus arachidicola TaxID=656916 RepID=A0A2G7G1Y8_9EURO|nr:hypothetical protein AARAC_009001 [Aspergillus arachidicola]